jgi:multiple sugar transport system substrate-binding protein
MIYINPSNGTYFISSTSNYSEEATDILMKMIGEDFQTKIANVMDQPPFNLSVLETADVAQAYRDSVEIFTKTMGVKPYLGIRNIDALQIEGNMKTVSPSPCEILNGYFAGAVKDWEGALHTYNDQMTTTRNESIKKCQSLGYKVSLDDYIFPNFAYGESYTSDKYAEL